MSMSNIYQSEQDIAKSESANIYYNEGKFKVCFNEGRCIWQYYQFDYVREVYLYVEQSKKLDFTILKWLVDND